MNEDEISLPDPIELLIEAEEEEFRANLSDYSSVIIALKHRNWTYRDIAEWLTKRRVPVSHMQVYRFYQRYEKLEKELEEAHIHGDDARIERLEQELLEYKPDEPDKNE
jgi:transposase-like protein